MTKGKDNFQWKGGVAEYPNHYEMKKNRLLKLKETKGLCEVCQKPAITIHHQDENKENHTLENLIILCQKCHALVHTGRKNKTSKFTRLYGMTLEEMSERFGGSDGYYYALYQKNKLGERLKELNKSILP